MTVKSASSGPLPSEKEQARFMQLALDEADKCIPTPTAFCVGAVVVSPSDSRIVATGFSRELPGNTHAEQCAIDKIIQEHGNERAKEILEGTDIYTTMEPCSVRLSGNLPCTNRIIEFKLGRVFLGTKEPDEFVECEGVKLLKEQGIQVYTVDGFMEKALEIARRGH